VDFAVGEAEYSNGDRTGRLSRKARDILGRLNDSGESEMDSIPKRGNMMHKVKRMRRACRRRSHITKHECNRDVYY
jgi:hypothetical protein